MRPYIFSKKKKNYYLNTFTKMTLNIYYQAKLKAFTAYQVLRKLKGDSRKKKTVLAEEEKERIAVNNSNHWVPSLQSSTFYQAIDPTNIGQGKNRWDLKNKKSQKTQ